MTRTIDAEGYERRTKRVGSLRCKCGNRVELSADTEEWVEASHSLRPIKWRHKAYGLPYGFCDCGFAFAGTFEGIARLDLRKQKGNVHVRH